MTISCLGLFFLGGIISTGGGIA
jgi:hypothetical protein